MMIKISIVCTRKYMENETLRKHSNNLEIPNDSTLRNLVEHLVDECICPHNNEGISAWILTHDQHPFAVIFPEDRKVFYLHSSYLPVSTLESSSSDKSITFHIHYEIIISKQIP